MNTRRLVIAVLLALAIPACAPSRETKALISTAAAVGDGNLREWNTLTAAERYSAHVGLVKAFHALDFTISDVAMPSSFSSTASVTSQ